MAVPRAQLGGMYGSGIVPQANPQIDIASIINAGAAGASSLLQGAYLRKMAEATRQANAAQRSFENRRQTEADQRAVEAEQWKRGEADRNYQLKVKEQEQKALEGGIRPAATIPPGVVSPVPTSVPERYDPSTDRELQRRIAVKQTPGAAAPDKRTPAEVKGTPQNLKAETDLADARARAAAKYRQPASEGEVQSQRVAIRQALSESRAKYMTQGKDQRGRPLPAIPPLEAAQRAMADQVAIFGEDAVRDAVGGIAPLKTPGPGLTDRARAIRVPNFGTKPAVAAPAVPGQAPAAAVAAPTRTPTKPTAAAVPVTPVPLRVPAAAAGAAPRTPAISEKDLTDADLWEVKRKHGLSPAAATAYVKARKKAS